MYAPCKFLLALRHKPPDKALGISSVGRDSWAANLHAHQRNYPDDPAKDLRATLPSFKLHEAMPPTMHDHDHAGMIRASKYWKLKWDSSDGDHVSRSAKSLQVWSHYSSIVGPIKEYLHSFYAYLCRCKKPCTKEEQGDQILHSSDMSNFFPISRFFFAN